MILGTDVSGLTVARSAFILWFPRNPPQAVLLKTGRGPGQVGVPFFSSPSKPALEDCVVEIQLGENDRLDWALKQFRRRMIRSGLFKDMRRKRHYEKPSEARKLKAKAAERRKHKDRKRAARLVRDAFR